MSSRASDRPQKPNHENTDNREHLSTCTKLRAPFKLNDCSERHATSAQRNMMYPPSPSARAPVLPSPLISGP